MQSWKTLFSVSTNQYTKLSPHSTVVLFFPASNLLSATSEIKIHWRTAWSPAEAIFFSKTGNRPLYWMVQGKKYLHPKFPVIPDSPRQKHFKTSMLHPGVVSLQFLLLADTYSLRCKNEPFFHFSLLCL